MNPNLFKTADGSILNVQTGVIFKPAASYFTVTAPGVAASNVQDAGLVVFNQIKATVSNP